jgi:hypothetical protein
MEEIDHPNRFTQAGFPPRKMPISAGIAKIPGFLKTLLKICRNRPVGFRAEQSIRSSYGPGLGGRGVWVVGLGSTETNLE